MTHEPPEGTDEPLPPRENDPPVEDISTDVGETDVALPEQEQKVEINVVPPPTWFMRTVFPGLEAVGWMVGTLIAIFTGSIAAAIVVSVVWIVAHPNSEFSPTIIEQEAMLPALIGSQVFLIGFAALGVFVRFGTKFPRTLGLRRLSLGHLLVVLGLTLPVQFLAHAWSSLASDLLESVGIAISSQEYMDQMQQILGAGPLVIMWLLMAVCPAVGEELIFRGIIGNTLVRNWGAWWGVLATSVLFGVMHLMPIQAIAVIPLGMAMHVVYLLTKSFWAPVLLHLANNSLALLMMEAAGELSEAEAQTLEEPLSGGILAASLLTALCLFGILWQTRRLSGNADAVEGEGEITSNPATPITYLAAALSLAGVGVLTYLMIME
ncbi:CAAX amino terminal protease self- immunity [Symmachiella macrocystis]|uniref:CAAX amino terminal protease self-immunity n=1 Tax=Symmachiella macrocystis TaxID=2527985 RepID=A0A5C6BC23_9PLAN|nr:type II CAAX endopeptidase family protein [Symmachiella macrocystis]TWU09480.1 CAAX amino terminal protease self- immunity [Symmachiella macrocystis]